MKISINGLTQDKDKLLIDLQYYLTNLFDNVLEYSVNSYIAYNSFAEKNEQRKLSGLQKTINERVDNLFVNDGWFVVDGRATKDRIQVRITFRHQMSIGTDFIEALKLIADNEVDYCVILVAEYDLVKFISPKDANSLLHYPKLSNFYNSYKSILPENLHIGSLSENVEKVNIYKKLIVDSGFRS